MNEFRVAIREIGLSSIELQKRIEDRFYPALLPEVKDPGFPCANFAITGGLPDPHYAEFGEIIWNLWSWSKRSLREASEIYELLETLFERLAFSGDSYFFFLQAVSRPLDAWDDISETHYQMGRWRARFQRIR
jgi:hypothetical protein